MRIPLAVVAFAWLWHVECGSLGFECRDNLSADHALSLATQGMVIFLVLSCGRTAAWLFRRCGKSAKTAPPAQFSIGFLLCWTTAIAMVLSLGKMALVKSGWNAEMFDGKMFFVGPLIGAYDAAVGLLVLGVFLGRKLWFLKVIGGLFVVALLNLTERPVLESLFGFNWGISTFEWYALAGFHLGYLVATLLPFTLCGGFSRSEVSGKTSDAAEMPGVKNSAFQDQSLAVK